MGSGFSFSEQDAIKVIIPTDRIMSNLYRIFLFESFSIKLKLIGNGVVNVLVESGVGFAG